MVSFARARTRSWISRLWTENVPPKKNETAELDKSNSAIENIAKQNKCFFEVSKNGGMWFS